MSKSLFGRMNHTPCASQKNLVAATRQEALRADRILPMCPNRCLDAFALHPVPAGRIRCRCAAGGLSGRQVSSHASKPLFGRICLTSSTSRKNPLPLRGRRPFGPTGFFPCVQTVVWTHLPYIQYQPEESVAAARQEAFRADRILPMRPNRCLDAFALHPVPARRIRCRNAAGGPSCRQDSSLCVQIVVWTHEPYTLR